jgi:hypothetical protein
MKKIILVIILLIPLFGISQTIDTISKVSHSTSDGQYFTYNLKVDNIYMSGYYAKKAGKNIIAGGVFLGFSVLSGIAPNFLPADQRTDDVVLGCAIASGVFLIGSMTEFITGGHKLKVAGNYMRKKGQYSIEVDGNKIRLKF